MVALLTKSDLASFRQCPRKLWLEQPPDGTVKVEAAVRNTPALRRWILRHGPAVEVLGPARLRAAIHDKLKAAAAAY